MKDCKMRTINLIIESVGGNGKGLISSILETHLQKKHQDNSGAAIHKLDLFNAQGQIDLIMFKQAIANSALSYGDIVVDVGASNLNDALKLIAKGEVQELLQRSSVKTFIHVLITGGEYQHETLNGLLQICKSIPPNSKIIAWLNEQFGQIEAEGKSFEELKLYINNRDKIGGIVRLGRQTSANSNEDNLREITRQLDVIFPNVSLNEQSDTALEKYDPKKINALQPISESEIRGQFEALHLEALARFNDALNASFEKQLDQLSVANALHQSEASNRAEIIITQAAEYLTKQMRQAADEITATAAKVLSQHVAEANRAVKQAKLVRNIAIVTLIITIAFLMGGIIEKFL